MTDTTIFRYDGKKVLVVGGATGMGFAAAKTVAELGAEVILLDRVEPDFEVARFVSVDLSDRAAVDQAVDELEGPFAALFLAAGVAGGEHLMRINFIAHRHLIDRLIADGKVGAGSAICLISSLAGLGWQNNMEQVLDFLATPDWAAADEWVAAHEGTNTYMFSKQAMNAYVARQAYPLMSKGIRINSICPGPTDTPLARANSWLDGFGSDYRAATGIPALTPEQMGNAMVFLNSAAASGVSGVSLYVDAGHIMSSIGGSYEPGVAAVNFLMSSPSH